MDERAPFRVGLGEAAGAVADLGVFVPLAAALVLVNGLDAGSVFFFGGLLYLAAGVAFRVPFPVQPLKALTAIAVSQRLSPDVVYAAGIELGAALMLISIGRTADIVASAFTKPVIRSLQLGVGVLLGVAAAKLVLDPPEVFTGVRDSAWLAALAAATFLGVLWAARGGRYWAALAVLAIGIGATALVAQPDLSAPALRLPSFAVPPASAFGTAILLLVVPQFPLTFGNAVVAVNDLSHEYFGERARRVSPSRICLTDGTANVVSGLLGGMPMCHGAGGLTAHVKLGAKTAGMNLLIGGVFLVLGLFFAEQVPEMLGLLPIWALAAFLAYAGVRHAWLAHDLRGTPLAIAVVSGAIGAATGNLAVTAGLALLADHGRRLLSRAPRG
ncbi:MAG TPA: putative sulfate/molybdate transporter [Actinomycetota bacterium]|nr:putative sulfate/molybdate transporter [Actinomycetota bacterium]